MTSSTAKTTTPDIARQTSQEYAKLLSNSSEFQLETVDETIESVLTRLDELYGMLDMIRSENVSATEELLPQVQVKIHCLNPLFKQIDQLEGLYTTHSVVKYTNTKLIRPLVHFHISLEDLDGECNQYLKKGFVDIVKKNVAELEAEVKIKEYEYSTLNSLKKAISGFSLFGRKKILPTGLSTQKQAPPYKAPAVFSAANYLAASEENVEEESSDATT